MDLTHASFFSGVGGLDLGLERAGWRTVSFSEIDPYANAVLTERWPGVANLGDILGVRPAEHPADGRTDGHPQRDDAPQPWTRAALWTAGFPCQDLSVAGKRRGFGIDYSLDPDDDPEHAPDIERQVATRSGLAFAFLDLVADVRPPAILLENVPGLLSSHGGRDLYTLVRALGQLGYGWAYRVLDARYFGVPQRRRRVFICALDAGRGLGAERAAEVLSVGHRCPRHPATGHQAGPGTAERAASGVDIARAVTGTSKRHDDDTDTLIAAALSASNGHHGHSSPRGDGSDNLVSASPDAGGVRAADGLAGGLDDRDGLEVWQGHGSNVGPLGALRQGNGNAGGGVPFVAQTLNSGGNNGGFRTEPGAHLVAYVKHSRYGEHGDPRRPDSDDAESWGDGDVSPSLDSIGHAPRTATAVLGTDPADDPLLPLGLDSHRYRCAGNGIVAPVAEYIGARLRAALENA